MFIFAVSSNVCVRVCVCVCVGGLFWPIQRWPQAWHPEDQSVQIQQQAGGGWNCRTGKDVHMATHKQMYRALSYDTPRVIFKRHVTLVCMRKALYIYRFYTFKNIQRCNKELASCCRHTRTNRGQHITIVTANCCYLWLLRTESVHPAQHLELRCGGRDRSLISCCWPAWVPFVHFLVLWLGISQEQP